MENFFNIFRVGRFFGHTPEFMNVLKTFCASWAVTLLFNGEGKVTFGGKFSVNSSCMVIKDACENIYHCLNEIKKDFCPVLTVWP